ncbi:hypothetical protein B0H14DRAFT_2581546 [Mycena olivaceomarginata]|nr:hypothetical protein B0H14DRAFT_2581546 [Mycena olivaceomarginata]
MRLGTDSSRVKLNKIDILALFGLLRALHLQELKEHCETRSKSYGRGIRSGMQALEAGRHSKWRLEVRGGRSKGWAWMAHSKLERRRQEFEVWGDGRSKWECMCSKWAGGRSKWPVTSSKWAGVRSGRAYRRSKWVRRGFERGDVAGRREDREPARGEGVRSPFEEVVGVNDDGMSTAFDRPDPRPNTETPARPKRKVELRGRKGLDIQVTLI